MCHTSTLDRLLEKNAQIWAYNALVGAGEEKILVPHGHFMIPGGSTSATRGLAVLRVLGFRHFRLFGYASSYADIDVVRKKGATYWNERADNFDFMARQCAIAAHYWRELDVDKASTISQEIVKDSQALPKIVAPVYVVMPDIGGDKLGDFWTDNELVAQAQDFEKLAKAMGDCKFEVFGDGFIPAAYRGLVKHNKLPALGEFDGILGIGTTQPAAAAADERHADGRTAGARHRAPRGARPAGASQSRRRSGTKRA